MTSVADPPGIPVVPFSCKADVVAHSLLPMELIMKAEKDGKYELKLSPQQQAEIKELTGRDGTVITFEIEELEERIAPKLASN